MQKQTGIHFYINIRELAKIVCDEENKTGGVTHSIHALDTFFSSIENFGRKVSKNLVVEKITGSRLHLYVVDKMDLAFNAVKAVSAYAYKLSKYINIGIPKYKTLNDFYINVGVAYGKFYDFEFTTQDGFSETTTIGYAANFAAKLQALSSKSEIGISEDIYDALPDDEKKIYTKVDEHSIEKYNQDKYYAAHLSKIVSQIEISDADMEDVKCYANRVNLSDIDFSGVHTLLNFSRLSKTQCKRLEGIPIFADVRGFTSQFEEDDSNIEEMAQKTQKILESMYKVSTGHGGIHVQFQGDRELSLYHNVPGECVNGVSQSGTKCYKTAVLASMRMIDAVKPYAVHIGVGADFGRLFAAKIGARGEKDNILLGETVIQADIMEDRCAGEDQVAITKEVYNGLKAEDAKLAECFKGTGDYFVATISYEKYSREVAYRQQQNNTVRNHYNGAWGDLV